MLPAWADVGTQRPPIPVRFDTAQQCWIVKSYIASAELGRLCGYPCTLHEMAPGVAALDGFCRCPREAFGELAPGIAALRAGHARRGRCEESESRHGQHEIAHSLSPFVATLHSCACGTGFHVTSAQCASEGAPARRGTGREDGRPASRARPDRTAVETAVTTSATCGRRPRPSRPRGQSPECTRGG